MADFQTLMAEAVEAETHLDLPKAFNTYEAALALTPDSQEVAGRLANLAFRLNMWPMAEKLYAHLISNGQHDIQTIVSFAASLREQSRFDEAVDILKTVIAQMPEEPAFWEGLGTIMAAQGDCHNALTFFNEALRLDPDHLHARFNRGCLLMETPDRQAGLADLAACLNQFTSPDNQASARIAYAQALLATGDLPGGWQAYEGREQYGTTKEVQYNLWSRRWPSRQNLANQPLAGTHLMVSAEQGLGDEVLFASLLPDLIRDLGPDGRLDLGVEPRLVSLFQRSFPDAHVVAHHTQTIDGHLQRSFPELSGDPADFWALMGDFLPVYRKDITDFPVQNAYLKPDAKRVAYWRGQMNAISDKPKIGILWKSLTKSAQRDRLFPPFKLWKNLLALDNISFINLQYGDTDAETQQVSDWGYSLHTPQAINLKDDLDDLAALCAAMDLIIAPSNATSNIAGACGVPTWMLTTPGCWTALGQANYPWYPSVRLFSPPDLTSWQPAMDNVHKALLERFSAPYKD
ncbi:MAG: tetratricopeptide repeat protein [Asticcacaulis sp.]